MKKIFTIIALLVFSYCEAQITRGLKGDFNTEKYPEVSFVWNTADPNVLEKSQFVLAENEENLDFGFEVLPKSNVPAQKNSILFLWEDMKCHSKQTENTKALLEDFFKKTVFVTGDQFNVAVFNRKKTDKDVLNFLLTEFVDDNDRLASRVSDYYEKEKDNSEFKSKTEPTDLYLAINEGINKLKAEPSDRVGVIIVVTMGLNMKVAGASTEMETVRKNAVEAGIPVYVIKYHQPSGDTPEVNSLAASTFGKTIYLTDKEVDKAVQDLQDLYKDLDSRCYGQDYKLTFTTKAKRDGKTHPINLTVNKVPQQIHAFTAPDMTFGIWVKEHLLLFILLILLLICLIVLTILLIVRGAKKRKQREKENLDKINREINKVNQESERLRREQERKERIKHEEEERKLHEAEEEKLRKLMRTKNMYPRLQCSVAGNSFAAQIDKPKTKIGRNPDNDVVLDNQTVSKYHAEIYFTGAAFEIVNKSTSYKDGIIVNGQFFQKVTLKSGDIIGLGEAVITFYV
jgi:hypothetical protein